MHLILDRQGILSELESDDDLLTELNACEIIYMRDTLRAVLENPGAVVPVEFNQEDMKALIEGCSCWLPVKWDHRRVVVV